MLWGWELLWHLRDQSPRMCHRHAESPDPAALARYDAIEDSLSG